MNFQNIFCHILENSGRALKCTYPSLERLSGSNAWALFFQNNKLNILIDKKYINPILTLWTPKLLQTKAFSTHLRLSN